MNILKLFLLPLALLTTINAYSQQQIIGTQAIGASYHFTKSDPVIEQAQRIQEMGSHMIKISYKNMSQLNAILAMKFDTFFFWWRSDNKIWVNGLSEADKANEYKATKEFAKYLLTSNANVKRTFYLGHWEGDWYLIPGYGTPDFDPNTAIEPNTTRINGMTDWLNIRQKAIQDARKEVPNSLSKVYQYTEVNRVRDAMDKNKKRVVNTVLPNTNVDYVSYSSYDVQRASQTEINKTIKYIEDKLPNKPGIDRPRVFIGEFGIEAQSVNFDPIKHEAANRAILIKYLKSGVPYILYWEMYNNEVDKFRNPKGFWLIDDKNIKQPLYYTMDALYKAQANFKDVRNESIEFLNARQ